MAPPAQSWLSGLALIFLGVTLLALLWVPVPQVNHDFIIYILGTLSGACIGAGATKIANTKAEVATVQPGGGS